MRSRRSWRSVGSGARPRRPSGSGRGCFESCRTLEVMCLGLLFHLLEFWSVGETAIYTVLRIGTILCWAIAIGSEYAAQQWPQRKKLLNIVAACCFGLALLGEADTYRYDDLKQSEMEAAIEAQGVPTTQWFQATNADEDGKTFTIGHRPITGSVDVLINGLLEPINLYDVNVNKHTVKVLIPLDPADQVIIKYRYKR